MCGIAGICSKTEENYQPHLQSMLQLIQHRGPENEGMITKKNVFLGHRRLKIIDISDRANQPMVSSCGRYIITYNGEIYNFKEIRQRLIQLGYAFQSQSDTEVILQAYRHWGESCVQQFNGIWAFCIFDLEQSTLFLSRDRFGVKPLYYILTEECFAFSSEIKALLPLLKQPHMNHRRMAEFLIYGKCEDHYSTFFDEVMKLKAGENIKYNTNSHQLISDQYYTLSKQPVVSNERELLEQGNSLLKSSIAYQLTSDVPVGISLSGGLDSSIITRHVADEINSSFIAFSAISEDKRNSELEYASAVVKDTGAKWVKTKPQYSDFSNSLNNIIATQEEPFSTPSIVMQYFLMKTVHQQGIKVLLDGQGADEVFLGYERYIILELLRSLQLSQVLFLFHNIRKYMRCNQNLTLKKLVYYSMGSVFPGLRQRVMKQRSHYLEPSMGLRPDYIYDYAASSRKSCFDLQQLEIMETNLPALLRFADKNSMGFSIENRVPYLDHRLVEYGVSLPLNMKIHQGWSKWVLRKMHDKYLPEGIVWRRNKIGYEAPENIWLQQHRPLMKERVMDSAIVNHFCNRNKLIRRFHKLNNRQLWRLYIAARWQEQFLSHG